MTVRSDTELDQLRKIARHAAQVLDYEWGGASPENQPVWRNLYLALREYIDGS